MVSLVGIRDCSFWEVYVCVLEAANVAGNVLPVLQFRWRMVGARLWLALYHCSPIRVSYAVWGSYSFRFLASLIQATVLPAFTITLPVL